MHSNSTYLEFLETLQNFLNFLSEIRILLSVQGTCLTHVRCETIDNYNSNSHGSSTLHIMIWPLTFNLIFIINSISIYLGQSIWGIQKIRNIGK